MNEETALAGLGRLVGNWDTEMTHPAMPGVVARGTVIMRWLEGERFLVQRAHTDHPDFPDFLAVIGITAEDRVDDGAREANPGDDSAEPMTMHYFDSRGVFRVYNVEIDATALRIWREAPGFSQRFAGRFEDNGATIAGQWHMSKDDVTWEDDVQITFRRKA